MFTKVLFAITAFFFAFSANSQVIYNSTKQQNWVDSVYNKLNSKEQLAQLFLIDMHGKYHPSLSKHIKILTGKNHLGGLHFSNVDPFKQVSDIKIFQESSKTPLLVGMNVTNGLSSEIPGALKYPSATTLSHIDDDSLLQEMQKHILEQLYTIGGSTLFAPAQNTNPSFLDSTALHEIGIENIYKHPQEQAYMFSSTNIEQSIKKIKRILRKDKIGKLWAEQNIREILKLKFYTSQKRHSYTTDNLYRKLNQPKHKVLIEALYKAAISMDSNELLPIQVLDTSTFASITFGEENPLCNQYLDRYTLFSHFNDSNNYPDLIKKLSAFKVVVANITTELNKQQVEFLNYLANETNLITCFYTSNQPKELSSNHKISAWENNAITQTLVPQFIFGAISNTDKVLKRLAFSLPEAAGIDSDVLKNIDKIAIEAITTKATPSCQILIAKDGKIIFDKNYGYYTYDSIKPITHQTIYDLASITKVAATLQSVIFMLDKGLIDLDYKISYYLPELKGTNKENMIIRDILAHQAGLWPWTPFWKNTMDDTIHLPGFYSYHPQDEYPFYVARGLYSNAEMEDKVWQWVIESDLRTKKDRIPYDYKYSDMGYYMLYHLAEKILNQPIEYFLAQNIYDPLGANTLSYLPLCKFPEDIIAPTENDTVFRKSQIVGSVHDQGAAMIGGVAGHAGLFGTATDLAKLMQMHLQNGEYGGLQYFQKETLAELQKPQYNSNRRGAGWDKPIPGAWYGPTGEFVSAKTYGHTGFTGTATWVDPEFNLVYIFLSNRVYPDADNAKLYRTNIRTRIQDVIYQAIWSYCDKNN